jgi:serine/threonine protein phosphatase PrpC
MASQLRISVGQYSGKGRKDSNQDFHGVYIPKEPQLSSKGIAIALADGISSSDVSHIASETAVSSFMDDYYCTSEAWSVKKSAQRVLMATNSWLNTQSQQSPYRYDKDKGYVCTFSALVLKSTTYFSYRRHAHLPLAWQRVGAVDP